MRHRRRRGGLPETGKRSMHLDDQLCKLFGSKLMTPHIAADNAGGVPLARHINDRLQEAVQRHPGHFAAFAAVPTADPKAAADEFERTVTKLGFKGAMINGLTQGVSTMIGAFGRSTSAPRRSTCRSTSTRRSRSRR
jgi:predicted TIM-barrel fold metal-dependent hydrolase